MKPMDSCRVQKQGTVKPQHLQVFLQGRPDPLGVQRQGILERGQERHAGAQFWVNFELAWNSVQGNCPKWGLVKGTKMNRPPIFVPYGGGGRLGRSRLNFVVGGLPMQGSFDENFIQMRNISSLRNGWTGRESVSGCYLLDNVFKISVICAN
jgi:hypothetical protein